MLVGVDVRVEVAVAVAVEVRVGVAVLVGVEVASAVQTFVGEEELRGLGAPIAKSVRLLSVSVQPFEFLIAAVVLLRFAVGVVSEQLALVP